MTAIWRDPGRFTKIGALAFWTVGFSWLLIGGGFTAFLRPSLWPLLAIGLVMAALLMLPCIMAKAPQKTVSTARRNALWMRMGILFLPLLCLGMAPHSVLDSYAFTKRSVQGSMGGGEGVSGGGMPGGAAAASGLSGIDLTSTKPLSLNVFCVSQNAQLLQGHRVIADGVVYRDETTPKGYFVLFRFVITCCAADASPVGLLVQEPDAGTFAEDNWVHVEGTVALKSLDGKERIVLDSSLVAPMKEPSAPYLYPQ